MRARSAAIASGDASVRSRIACQRMAGSESSSQLMGSMLAMVSLDRSRSFLQSTELGEHQVPVNGDPRDRCELCLPFELENGRVPITPCFEAVNRHRALNGIDEPNLAYAGTFVRRKLNEPVVPGGAR